MKISILSDQGDFSERLCDHLQDVENVEKVFISINLNDLYQQLINDNIVDLCIVETPSLCHDEAMRIGGILQHFVPSMEIIFISEYIMPFTKRAITEKKWTFYEKDDDLEPLVERILKNHKEVKAKTSTVRDRMTVNEIRVLQLIATGLRQVDVATVLNLSPRTINNHLANIYFKLGVNSSIAAVVEAIKKGIITIKYDNDPPSLITEEYNIINEVLQ